MARIMIVTDHQNAALDLQSIVQRMGHSVTGVACTEEDALHQLKESAPDIAFLDLVLRDRGDGISLAAQLQHIQPIKILFIANRVDQTVMDRAADIAPCGYLVKPFSDDTVFTALSAALHNKHDAVLSADLQTLSEGAQPWTRLPRSIVKKVEDYVANNFDNEITLRAMAELANMSESSFSRRFKITQGITPYQYVMKERLQEAKRLLRDTDWPLVDVAVATGFSSQSHFATAFKKSYQVTPLQFRKM